MRRSAGTSTNTAALSEFRPVSLLGVGRLAAVYRAENREGHAIAWHMLHEELASEPLLSKRFLDGARRSRRLRHPSVVRVQGEGQRGGVPFVVTELMTAPKLATQLAEPWPEKRARTFATQLAAALAEAHAAGFVHGHLTETQIWVDADGTPHLHGFGWLGLREATTRAHRAEPAPSARLPGPDADVVAAARLVHRVLSGAERTTATLAELCPHVDAALTSAVDEVFSDVRKGQRPTARAFEQRLRGRTPSPSSDEPLALAEDGDLAPVALRARLQSPATIIVLGIVILLVWMTLRALLLP